MAGGICETSSGSFGLAGKVGNNVALQLKACRRLVYPSQECSFL